MKHASHCHRRQRPSCCSALQRGFLLIEALVAILIFSLGVLGMVALGGTAISAQSDAHYRTDAARLADDIISTIAVSVDRSSSTALASSLAPFQHQPSGTECGAFSGAASGSPLVTNWVSEVETAGRNLPGLPGATDSGQQILVDSSASGFNRVQVTVCWRAPGTPANAPMRRHTVVSFIN